MAIDPTTGNWCVSRRAFLSGTAAMAGLWTLGGRVVPAESAPVQTAKTRIRLVFSHHRQDEQGKQSEPGWPYLGYDQEGRKKQLLARLRESCTESEFLPVTALTAEDGKKILEADKEVDGYLAYMIGGWAGAAETIAASGRPTIYVGDLYGASGEFLCATAAARRKHLKAFGVSSSRFEDVVQAVRCLETMKKLKSSTILVVGGERGDVGKAIEQVFGTKVVPITFPQINEAYKKADRAQAKQWADKWMREAQKVVEPSPEEIWRSGAMYLALRSLMDQHQAQAITMNCLGGVYSGQTHAYPCLGFFQLNNDGLVGACEADQQSTITMLLMKYLVGKPGYISDPIIDTATNRVIYIHCVAPSKVFGPDGQTNPYEIRSHSEDRKGAAVRSLMPVGHMTTTIQFAPTRREVILHQARTVDNIDEDRVCRSKLAAEVKGDINKLLGQWDLWGWHRVTFYGDHKLAVQQISALLGFGVVEEA
jgi:hypothetical protein